MYSASIILRATYMPLSRCTRQERAWSRRLLFGPLWTDCDGPRVLHSVCSRLYTLRGPTYHLGCLHSPIPRLTRLGKHVPFWSVSSCWRGSSLPPTLPSPPSLPAPASNRSCVPSTPGLPTAATHGARAGPEPASVPFPHSTLSPHLSRYGLRRIQGRRRCKGSKRCHRGATQEGPHDDEVSSERGGSRLSSGIAPGLRTGLAEDLERDGS
jgi:hypothetical protein